MKKPLPFSIVLLAVICFGVAGKAWGQCPPAACKPGTANSSNAPFIQSGIYSVKLGSVTFSGTGYADGYLDSSCGTRGASAIAGTSFSIDVTTGAQIQENVRVWLDANNNGVFDSTGGELVFSSNNAFTHSGTITVPVTALLNQKLRLRVASDANISGLPSPCRTPEYGQSRDFWVLALGNTQPPVADFSSLDTLTCSGNVAFKDLSSFAPTHWAWTFGDGGTDTVQNPTHFYAASGTYSVQLVVRNKNGSDTLLRSNYIRFNDTIPVASCNLTTIAPCCNTYISKVGISPVNPGATPFIHTSPAISGGYEDYSCQYRVRLVEGKAYKLALTTGPNTAQASKAWIDANGNGQFEDSEVILNNRSAINPADTFVAPVPTGAAVGKPVRLRILSDGTGTNLAGCTNLQIGQAEDYTLLLLENKLPPVVALAPAGGSLCDSVYLFKANYENAVTEFNWNFGDGTQQTTTTDTVRHAYAAHGTFGVSVQVKGPFGEAKDTVANAVRYQGGPAQATCGGPVTGQICCNIGIFNLKLGTINQSSESAAQEGYKDFSCQSSAELIAGTAYPVLITTGAQQPETSYFWVDLNNNQDFDASELVLTIPRGTRVRSGSLTLPNSAVQNIPLRLRVVSTATQGTTPSPCAVIQFGQIEDYSVIAVPNTVPPIANFGAVDTLTCSSLIQFTDSSFNATSYKWYFGDGDSSTLAAPSHTYKSIGYFTVKLVVTNAFGSSTKIRQRFVHLLKPVNLVAASCSSSAQQPQPQAGIFKVDFGQISNITAGAADGYKDYSCSQTATVPLDTTLTLTVQTGAGNPPETVGAWIDYNSDGQFDPTTEKIAGGAPTGGVFTATIKFPNTAAVNKGLRLRVISDFVFGGGTLGPCQTVLIGQMEDYSIFLTATTTKAPKAYFSASNTKGCSGLVAFKDSSANFPTAWRWNFGDNTTDSTQSPTHQYTQPGTYTVTLVAINSLGHDSTFRTDFVVYKPLAGLAGNCAPTYSTQGQTVLNSFSIEGQAIVSRGVAADGGLHHDITCSWPVLQVSPGDSISIAAQLNQGGGGPRQPYTCNVYIDANGDGQFGTGELVRSTTVNGNVLTGKFKVPNTTLVGTPLRVRIIFGHATIPGQPAISGPCGAISRGESYDIALKAQILAPVSKFSYSQPNACGLRVNFNQQATGAPTLYTWYFGDNSAPQVSPNASHTYAAAGTYTVSLVVVNAVGKDSSAQEIKLTEAPVVATCSPKSYFTGPTSSGQTGISRMTATNQTTRQAITRNSQAAFEGYQDLTCTTTVLTAQQKAPIRVQVTCQTSPNTQSQVYEVYLDVNNDASFDASERMGGATVVGPATATINFNIPDSAKVALLRMRVLGYVLASKTTCDSILNGQAEDYGLSVQQYVAINSTLALASKVQVLPNPALTEVTVTVDDLPATGGTLTLLDVQGRALAHESLPGGSVVSKLSVEALPAGLYVVRIQSTQGQVMKRLMVAK